uniref:Uncharacterized protein n=1 Tax=Brassica oleracea var. oleracea TaxID=109376 RepID=A0A0D3C3I7_BRAOL
MLELMTRCELFVAKHTQTLSFPFLHLVERDSLMWWGSEYWFGVLIASGVGCSWCCAAVLVLVLCEARSLRGVESWTRCFSWCVRQR